MSGSERREEILQAAVAEFALKGLEGTSTEAIAHRAGVSQPYIFHFFGTKKELFLAAVERGFDRVQETFRLAVESNPEDVLEAMGHAYKDLLTRREALLLQMQAYAACSDSDVQRCVRNRYGELYRYVTRVSGAGGEKVQAFFAIGMLLNVAAAMDLPSVLNDEEWACTLLGDLD